MNAKITTDATEGEIEGTLTQISPTASSQNGGFPAEVTVTTPNSGLYVGINATVEIIQFTVDNVFVVPIDAIGTMTPENPSCSSRNPVPAVTPSLKKSS